MKILMTLMGLEIGGAETHVVELSKALKNMGHDITVASNGGVYQKELEEHGIPHINIPLHSKKPWLFLKSFIRLNRLFKKEEFDIVHAHARIPAFICGLFEKKYKFRYVTTAHWVFKINPLWKRVANWGEKTIAVSDDIKEYLIKNYGTWADNISTTINGIDTAKFSKSIDYSDVAKEFNLESGKYRILYVSRMDKDRSAVAYMAASAMPKIVKMRPDAELVIVGDGNDFENLKAHTDKINAEIGHRAIILTGARVDVNKFVAASDVFVGVSRSALEAMAAGIPVVIAGNEGYIGIFNESNFKVSYDTNYCCRGCIPATNELILSDLTTLLKMSDEELRTIKEYNQGIINTYYSAYAMAKDYDDMYSSLTPLKKYKYADIIINGYYGYKNIGDEALLSAIVKNVKSIDPDAKITVLSASPKETSGRYHVNSVHRFNIFRIIKEMKHAKLYINGGGSLLQDVTSSKSLFYYTYLIKLAKRYGLKTMIYANGFGPIRKKHSLSLAKSAIENSDYISTREPSSAEAIRKIFKDKEIFVTSDPAFSLSPANDKWSARICAKYKATENSFAISLRDWQTNDDSIVEKIADYCSFVYDKYHLTPVFIVMQNSKDLTISKRIAEKLTFESSIVSDVTPSELISILGKMKFSIGMRLHFLVFSIISNVPAISMSYDPKINSLMEYMELPSPISSSGIDIDELKKMTDYLVTDAESIREKISGKVSYMVDKTKFDAKSVFELI